MSALSANIVSITGLTAINTIPINEFAVPTGSMFAWCKYIPTPPSGYLICNGAQYSQSSFPNLYAVIGNTYNQPLPSPGNFRVPNMNGRVPMGTVITDDNLPPGNERINVTVTASVAVNTPTGVRNGLYCVYTDGAIYENMICTTAGMVTGPIDAIIYDTVPANAGYFVILPRNFTTFSGPFGNAQFYFDTNTRAFQAPSIANNFTFGASRGFSMYPQATDEVGVHNHGTVATGSTNNASAASGRSEPNFSVPDNQGIYNFTPPGGSPQNASAGLRYIPPNTSTWWIIKT
jgi:microcystin-dependent protein